MKRGEKLQETKEVVKPKRKYTKRKYTKRNTNTNASERVRIEVTEISPKERKASMYKFLLFKFLYTLVQMCFYTAVAYFFLEGLLKFLGKR